jgi:hypothetical protein
MNEASPCLPPAADTAAPIAPITPTVPIVPTASGESGAAPARCADRPTPASLQPLCAALAALEPLYHAACPQASLADFDRCVADGFWEIGASGLRYDRAWARQALAQRPGVPPDAHWRCEDWRLQSLTPDLMLLSYRLIQPWRRSQRMTLWQRCGLSEQPWLAVFHQGTPELPVP